MIKVTKIWIEKIYKLLFRVLCIFYGGCVILTSVLGVFTKDFQRRMSRNKTCFRSSSKPPNTQPTKKVVVEVFKICGFNICYSFDIIMDILLKDTRRWTCMFHRGCTNSRARHSPSQLI